MIDAYITMRSGEIRPIYVTETATGGTLSVRGNPSPLFTLADFTGLPVPGYNGVPVTGYTPGAQAAPEIWILLDTTVLAPGNYTGEFVIRMDASDGTSRIYRPQVELEITEA